jgi:hypothetical protein
MTAAAPASEAGRVTSIDLWKTAALALILLDHLGFFLLTDQPWLMAVGRAALPIFFFLIGFARTRSVPWFWWAAGLGLTALDAWRVGDWREINVNILINFALIRLALPLIEAQVMGRWWRVILFAIALAALMPFSDVLVEYGTEGWLLALVGLAHRRALESGPDAPRDPAWLTRRALGAFATLAFAAMQLDAYAFAMVEAWVMAGAVIAASGLLLRFRPGVAPWRLPAPLGHGARLCGRRSLEIYIAQIVAGVGLGLALGVDAVDVHEMADEEE